MGIIQSIKEMGRKPKLVYTDGETGFDSYALRDYFVKENVKHYINAKPRERRGAFYQNL